MKIKEIFNLDVLPYSKLEEPSRAVSKSYLDGNRFLDTTKEYVYIEQGMPFFSDIIHKQAHKFLAKLDVFGDLLHERHIIQIYPETPELDYIYELQSIDDVFSMIIRTLNNIQEALEEFHKATDNADFRPMALKTEELMLQNSQDYTKFLEAWTKWDEDSGSKTSYDKWIKTYFEVSNDE